MKLHTLLLIALALPAMAQTVTGPTFTGGSSGTVTSVTLCTTKAVCTSSTGDGWRPMQTAPKDGTIIEIRCTYGVAPWYGLFKWTETITAVPTICDLHGVCKQGAPETMRMPGWHKVGDEQMGIIADPSFNWRPYKGNPKSYIDPTHGAQETDEYWRRAAMGHD